MTNINSILKSRDITNKSPYSQRYVFPIYHEWMWEVNLKEGWVPKDLCFRTVVLEKTLEGPLDCKDIKSVNPKEINTDYSLEGLVLKLKVQFLATWYKESTQWKRPVAGKDWRQEEKGTTEGKMVGWDRRLNGHEFEQTLEDGDGQGSLTCCSPWGGKDSDMTEWLGYNKN